jgi:DNA-binding Xre family transcriptional regulator
MLFLDISRVMSDRGITHPSRFLREHGFTYQVIHKVLNGNVTSATFKTLERLCLALNCAPSDLFAWEPSDSMQVPPGHPLHKLKAQQQPQNLASQIRQLPPDKLDALRDFVSGLEQDGQDMV